MSSPQGAESNEIALATNNSESNRWLIAQQRLRESGIPPAHERLWARGTLASQADDHVESALAECTRTEANLGALMRGLSHLSAGAAAARDANAALLRELDAMRELLGRSNENELTLICRVRALEQALDTAEHDAALSRAVLIEQEDLFLAELLTDHEREIATLKQALAEAQDGTASAVGALPISTLPPPPDFEAEAELDRIDTLPPPPDFSVATAASPEASLSTDAPPRRSDSRPIAAVALRTISVDLAEIAPAAEVSPTPAPAASDESPSRRDSRPSLKQKPDPSTRPLVGYSLGADEVAEEVIDTSRLGSHRSD
jgi:hypothetical protein